METQTTERSKIVIQIDGFMTQGSLWIDKGMWKEGIIKVMEESIAEMKTKIPDYYFYNSKLQILFVLETEDLD